MARRAQPQLRRIHLLRGRGLYRLPLESPRSLVPGGEEVPGAAQRFRASRTRLTPEQEGTPPVSDDEEPLESPDSDEGTPESETPETPAEVSTLEPYMGVLNLSAAARVAGVVIALGYLVGLVPGPLVAAIGGVGVITFGRLIVVDKRWAAIGAFAFGIITLAALAGALRWGTSSLDAIRGAQAVLGPTLTVEPQDAAIGAGLAAGAGTLGLALWLGTQIYSGVWRFVWSCVEAVVVAL